jgi:Fe-S-cluster containining protein
MFVNERLPAGDFSSWVTGMQGALRGDNGSDVPCGSCTACCTSSQFVHIAPDEKDTLSRIPSALLFPAPRLPRGHKLLGYDERGHCPMLVDDKCSIYEHRPRTCRVYDCRVFPAAGITNEDADKALIDQQAKRWRFDYSTEDSRVRHEAVQAAATFLADHAAVVFDGAAVPNATQRAVLAVELHDTFVGRTPDPQEVRVELTRRRDHQ